MGWAGLSGGHGREPDGRSIADGGDGLQGHVARALGGPLVGLLQQQRPDKPDNGGLVREYADDISPALDLAVEPLNRVGNGYEGGGACLIRLGRLPSWRMVRPSGTRGTGSTSVGRPMYSMSRELALVAGRPCDRPGCAESADP